MHQPRNVAVGEKIFLGRFTGWDWAFTKAVIVSKTPKGLIDVQIHPESETMRFRTNGNKIGAGYHDYEIDWMPFAEREDALAKEARAKAARTAIRSITIPDVGQNYDKTGLEEILNNLQAKIDEARALVAEI